MTESTTLLEECIVETIFDNTKRQECEDRLLTQSDKNKFTVCVDNINRYRTYGDFQPGLPKWKFMHNLVLKIIAEYDIKPGTEPPKPVSERSEYHSWTIEDFDILYENMNDFREALDILTIKGFPEKSTRKYFKIMKKFLAGEKIRQGGVNKTFLYYCRLTRELQSSPTHWTSSASTNLLASFIQWTDSNAPSKDRICAYFEFAQSTFARKFFEGVPTDSIAVQLALMYREKLLNFSSATRTWTLADSIHEEVEQIIIDLKNRELMQLDPINNITYVPDFESTSFSAKHSAFKFWLKLLCGIFKKKITVYAKNPKRVFIDLE